MIAIQTICTRCKRRSGEYAYVSEHVDQGARRCPWPDPLDGRYQCQGLIRIPGYGGAIWSTPSRD